METNYNAQHFINRFESIPEEMWCTGLTTDSRGRHCAWGFICPDRKYNEETKSFQNLLLKLGVPGGDPSLVNNGNDPRYQQPTPKQRILAALYDIKKMQEPKPQIEVVEKVVTIYQPVYVESSLKPSPLQEAICGDIRDLFVPKKS